MLEDLQKRAEQAVALAEAAGADGVFAWASRSREVEMNYRDGKLESVKESTSRSLSIEVYAGGRYSSHATTDLREDRLRAFVRDAVALTRALQPDPFRALPDPALYEGRSGADLDLQDPAVLALDAATRHGWLSALDAEARGAPEVVSATSWLADSHDLSAGCSSNGFFGTNESTSLWFGAEVTLRDKDEGRPEEGAWVGGHHRHGLPEPETVAREALSRALSRLGSVRGPTARTTMVVEPRAAGRLVFALLRPARAGAVQQARSFWAGRVGQPLFSERFTLRDEPLLPRGLASRPFDGEGLAARPLPIVEAGVARNLYVDTYYGRKLGLPPTTGSSSNLVLGLGDKPLDALVSEVGEGVLVTSWLGGNSDDNNGDFSYGLRGFRIAGGKVGEPIGEMNATGNLVELFARLAATGNDPYPWSNAATPTLVFEDVQFSGA